MKKPLLKIVLIICIAINDVNAQTANMLSINDTRGVNDSPNFSVHNIRADFKERGIIGVPGEGYWSTNLTLGQWKDNTGDKNHQLNFNNGGIFYRNAFPADTHWGGWRQLLITNENGNVGIGTTNPTEKLDVRGNISVWGLNPDDNNDNGQIIFENINHGIRRVGNIVDVFTSGGSESGLTFTHRSYNASTNSYTNMVEAMKISYNGNVGIGTTNPTNKLDVNGTIHSKEVKVDMEGWSDFVFRKEYKLPTLEEVEKQIAEKGHLENIPNEEEVLKNGINLGEMNAKLLQKIEELTLYSIEQNKKNEIQNKEIELLKSQMKEVLNKK